MRLTNREIYEAIERKRDVVDFPYYSEGDMSPIFNSEYIAYVEKISRLPESEPLRSRISPLISSGEVPGGADRVSPDDMEGMMKLLSVSADFNFECRGKVRLVTRPVTPVTTDALNVILDDPSQSPSNHFPSYIEDSIQGRRSIRVLSKSAPERIYLTYYRYPSPVDFVNDPNGYMEVDRLAQEEIIDATVSMLAAIVGSNNYNLLKNEQSS